MAVTIIIKIIFLWGQKIIFFPVSKLSRKNMRKEIAAEKCVWWKMEKRKSFMRETKLE